MSLNPTTKTAGQVARTVKRQFGDESGTQITDEDIFRWIDSAQLEIVSQIQAIKAESTTDIVGGQSRYDLTELAIHQIESIHYNGKKITVKSFSEAELEIGSNTIDTGDPLFAYHWANVVTLYPTPEKSIDGGLRIYYTKMPTLIEDASTILSLPDKHLESIILWVLHKAYELDEEFQQSDTLLERFSARILDQHEEEYSSRHSTYQTITIVE